MGLLELYRKFDQWRRNCHHMWLERKERKQFFDYLDTVKLDDGAEAEIKEFYQHHSFYDFPNFPYEWAQKRYMPTPDVRFDQTKEMYYADWHGKRLYWKKGVTKHKVQVCVRDLELEQHVNSPHRYEFPNNLKQAVIADLGAAEGCFTLDVIERIDHAYLFECDEEWIEPLTATFEPWKDKVTIVSMGIGNQDGDGCTTLDSYFADKTLDFVKADIEGAEIDMLSSGEKTLRDKVRGANICLYHRLSDEQDILAKLQEFGYDCKVNPGYMIFRDNDNPQECLRHGVVNAFRN